MEDNWWCERSRQIKFTQTDLGLLAINKALLKNPFITCLKLKQKLGLVATPRTIQNYCALLGWKKVNTKYCQIVSPVNSLKRFTYACCCKLFNEVYEDVTCIDETTVEIRLASYKNWRKPSDVLSRAAGGKIGKPKHSNVKIHLLGCLLYTSPSPRDRQKSRMPSSA